MADQGVISDNELQPERTAAHAALAVFLGDWRATGKSYGRPDQDPDDPKGNPETWTSRHTCVWHTGEFFLIADERAMVGSKQFDALSIMGVDPASGEYFAHGFENHGFERRYAVKAEGRVWTLTGGAERATITFSEDGRSQDIVWEWKPGKVWLPLCDRTATRVVSGQARA
jgi:hypothetical protein